MESNNKCFGQPDICRCPGWGALEGNCLRAREGLCMVHLLCSVCFYLLIVLSSVLLIPFVTSPSITLQHFTFSTVDNCCLSEGEDLFLQLLQCPFLISWLHLEAVEGCSLDLRSYLWFNWWQQGWGVGTEDSHKVSGWGCGNNCAFVWPFLTLLETGLLLLFLCLSRMLLRAVFSMN